MFVRLINIIKGFLFSSINIIEEQNPEFILENEKQKLKDKIEDFNKSLIEQNAYKQKLIRTIRDQEKNIFDLKIKINHFKDKDRITAGELAIQYNNMTESLDLNNQQLFTLESMIKDLTNAKNKAIQAATNRIESLKQKISNTKMVEAYAELKSMNQNMINGLSNSADTLNLLEDNLNARQDQALGKLSTIESIPALEHYESKEAENALLEFERKNQKLLN